MSINNTLVPTTQRRVSLQDKERLAPPRAHELAPP